MIHASDFPSAPQSAVLYTGTERIPVSLDVPPGEVVRQPVRLEPAQPQIIALTDNDLVLYGAAIFSGSTNEIPLNAASTVELTILAAPFIWADDNNQVSEALHLIQIHADYAPLVSMARASLRAGPVETSLNTPEIATLATRIVMDVSGRLMSRHKAATSTTSDTWTRSSGPGAKGSVILVPDSSALAFGVSLEAPFYENCRDLTDFPLRIVNLLPRYIAVCRRDFVAGSDEPIRTSRFPPGLIAPGYPLHPAIAPVRINFDEGALDRVSLTLIGPGPIGRPPSKGEGCVPTDPEQLAMLAGLFVEPLGIAFAAIAPLNPYLSFVDAIVGGVDILGSYWTAVERDDPEAGTQLVKDGIDWVFDHYPHYPIPAIEGLRIGRQILFPCVHAFYFAQLTKASAKAEYTLSVLRAADDQCSGDLSWTWYFGFEQQGLRSLTYNLRMGQMLEGDELGLIFGQGEGGVPGPPYALVWVEAVSSVNVNEQVGCRMVICLGVDENDLALSPFRCSGDASAPTLRTSVYFTKLELPEGIFPGRASGAVFGKLGVFHSGDRSTGDEWCETVTIPLAPFTDVRVYRNAAAPGASLLTRSLISPGRGN